MKTAISVPDSVFKAAERLAQDLGMSRSELYTKAVAAFVEQYRRGRITETLNQIYETESNSLDPVLAHLQSSVLTRESW